MQIELFSLEWMQLSLIEMLKYVNELVSVSLVWHTWPLLGFPITMSLSDDSLRQLILLVKTLAGLVVIQLALIYSWTHLSP